MLAMDAVVGVAVAVVAVEVVVVDVTPVDVVVVGVVVAVVESVEVVVDGSANACEAVKPSSSAVARPAIHHPGRGIGRHYHHRPTHSASSVLRPAVSAW
ncbi:MAG TPA: hypothetical protein VMS63_04265 [Gaiellaceae bacterium]|nr:hypothetical protein [Gaiellaceae bacterium]